LLSHLHRRKRYLMREAADTTIVHGSAVAFAGRGVLILGGSGAGKSALALALIGRGAALVADDRVVLTRRGNALLAAAPEAIPGLIEARGIGILRLPAVPEAAVTLAVDLDRPPAARMPQPETITYLGISIELIFGRDIPNLDCVLTIIVQNGRDSPR
jgi:HPr kinase/phosphorylase